MSIELQLLGIAGMAVHYLKEWNAANNEGKQYNLKRAIPTVLLSGLTTGLLIYLRKDIEDIYPITKFSAVVLGYLGNSIFFSFVNAKKPKVVE